MKKLIYAFTLIVLFSCGPSNKYEKLISDYAQTDRHGTWTDIQFKALEIKELTPITVSDSLKILQEAFDENKTHWMTRLETSLSETQTKLDKEQKSRFKSKTIIDMYTKHIHTVSHRIDSVKASEFQSSYLNEKLEKVLLQPVQCRYSYVFPPTNPRQEITEIFYFTPDGKRIVSKTKVK